MLIERTITEQVEIYVPAFPFFMKSDHTKDPVTVTLFLNEDKCLRVAEMMGSISVQESDTRTWLEHYHDNGRIMASKEDFARALQKATARFESYFPNDLFEAFHTVTIPPNLSKVG